MNENRNLFLAIILVVGILFGFNYFYERPKLEAQQKNYEVAKQLEAEKATPEVKEVAPIDNREDALKTSERLKIETNTVQGSIALTGGFIDDIRLLSYQETTDKNNEAVKLLNPTALKQAYFAAFSWTHTNKEKSSEQKLPSNTTTWKSSADILKNEPVKLIYNNGTGLVFERTISIDENYMFTVTDKVTNQSKEEVSLKHQAFIERHEAATTAQGGFILHEGPIGVINSKLYEVDYDAIKETPKPRETFFENAERSWIGFTDKYWLTALIPDVTKKVNMSFTGNHDNQVYKVTAEAGSVTLKPGESTLVTNHVYAGAKQLELLDSYEAKLGFEKFDLAIDFGWFYFLTKPLLYLLKQMDKFLGNFGIAILVLTIIMKVLFFPLANKSYRSMSRMRAFQPQIKAIQERYGNDRMKMNQALMELYQKQKINPMSGCLPMLIQAPIFFCLYKVLYVCIEMRHAPFYGWIHDLSAPDPTSIVNLFGLLPFESPSFIPHIGLWPVLMGLSMWLQQKLNPQPADKAQAMMFMIMPIFLTFLFATFPAGLVIYWTWSNVLGIIQQWAIMRIEEKRTAAVKK